MEFNSAFKGLKFTHPDNVQLCSCVLQVVMSQNVNKSSTSHVNAQMYIYRVASCLKLTGVTSVLISMFSEQFLRRILYRE